MFLFFIKSIIESTVQERLADRDQRTVERFCEKHNIQTKQEKP